MFVWGVIADKNAAPTGLTAQAVYSVTKMSSLRDWVGVQGFGFVSSLLEDKKMFWLNIATFKDGTAFLIKG
jgi:hypothetical protein